MTFFSNGGSNFISDKTHLDQFVIIWSQVSDNASNASSSLRVFVVRVGWRVIQFRDLNSAETTFEDKPKFLKLFYEWSMYREIPFHMKVFFKWSASAHVNMIFNIILDIYGSLFYDHRTIFYNFDFYFVCGVLWTANRTWLEFGFRIRKSL